MEKKVTFSEEDLASKFYASFMGVQESELKSYLLFTRLSPELREKWEKLAKIAKNFLAVPLTPPVTAEGLWEALYQTCTASDGLIPCLNGGCACAKRTFALADLLGIPVPKQDPLKELLLLIDAKAPMEKIAEMAAEVKKLPAQGGKK